MAWWKRLRKNPVLLLAVAAAAAAGVILVAVLIATRGGTRDPLPPVPDQSAAAQQLPGLIGELSSLRASVYQVPQYISKNGEWINGEAASLQEVEAMYIVAASSVNAWIDEFAAAVELNQRVQPVIDRAPEAVEPGLELVTRAFGPSTGGPGGAPSIFLDGAEAMLGYAADLLEDARAAGAAQRQAMVAQLEEYRWVAFSDLVATPATPLPGTPDEWAKTFEDAGLTCSRDFYIDCDGVIAGSPVQAFASITDSGSRVEHVGLTFSPDAPDVLRLVADVAQSATGSPDAAAWVTSFTPIDSGPFEAEEFFRHETGSSVRLRLTGGHDGDETWSLGAESVAGMYE